MDLDQLPAVVDREHVFLWQPDQQFQHARGVRSKGISVPGVGKPSDGRARPSGRRPSSPSDPTRPFDDARALDLLATIWVKAVYWRP
jgi:hypothetical protein